MIRPVSVYSLLAATAWSSGARLIAEITRTSIADPALI
jgi:hypothetical protein